MRIRKVVLHNFRPFYGSQSLELDTENEHSVVLVKADNDVGKTSLFKAVQFCLYGERSQDQVARHINRTAAKERDGTMSVKIIFSHEGSQYELTRKVDFEHAPAPSLPKLKEHAMFEVRKDGVLETLKSQEDENNYVESILPEDASQFFLFDGEQIQKYTQHPPGDRVKGAIEMVLGVKELLNARDDMDRIEADISSELTKLLQEDTKDKEEADKMGRLEAEIGELQTSVATLERRILEAKENVEKCDEELDNYKELQGKVTERINAETDLSQTKDQIKANEEELRDFNRNLGPLMVAPLLTEFAGLLQESNGAPKEFERMTAASILAEGRCICGREIDEQVKERLSALSCKTETSRLLQLKEQAEQLLIEFEPKSLESKLYDLLNTKSGLESHRSSIETKIDALDKQLGMDAQELGDHIKNT